MARTCAGLRALPQATTEYPFDAWQRSIRTWELRRQRGKQHLEHAKSGKPPVPDLGYEMVVDGRRLDKPARARRPA